MNADVVQNIIDGKILFAIDQQPYVQGYLGVTGIYLKVLNGNDIGGGQPVYSGPAIITKDNAAGRAEVRPERHPLSLTVGARLGPGPHRPSRDEQPARGGHA